MALTDIVSTISAGGYRVEGKVNGTDILFLVDTGAAATLLRKDTWERVNTLQKQLTPCTEQRLVSVDGSPLQIHGRAKVELNLAGEGFDLEVTVVSTLMSEANWGLIFFASIR